MCKCCSFTLIIFFYLIFLFSFVWFVFLFFFFFFFSSRRRHTRWTGDWSSDVCSSDLRSLLALRRRALRLRTQRGGAGGRCRPAHRLGAARAGAAVAAAREIGRASCRERVEVSGGAVSLKKKSRTWEEREVRVRKRREL